MTKTTTSSPDSNEPLLLAVVLRATTVEPLRHLDPYVPLGIREEEDEDQIFLGIPDQYPLSLTFNKASLDWLLLRWWEPYHYPKKGMDLWTSLSPSTDWMNLTTVVGQVVTSVDYPVSPESKLCRDCKRPCEVFAATYGQSHRGEVYAVTCPPCRLREVFLRKAQRQRLSLPEEGLYFQKLQTTFIQYLESLAREWWTEQQSTMSLTYTQWQESERNPLDPLLEAGWFWLQLEVVTETIRLLSSEETWSTTYVPFSHRP